MANIKPIVLDETLQALVSTQTEIKNILSTDSFSPSILQNKNITVNGTYSAETGYDGFSQVTVNVSGGGGGNDYISLFNGTATNWADVDKTLTKIRQNFGELFTRAQTPTGTHYILSLSEVTTIELIPYWPESRLSGMDISFCSDNIHSEIYFNKLISVSACTLISDCPILEKLYIPKLENFPQTSYDYSPVFNVLGYDYGSSAPVVFMPLLKDIYINEVTKVATVSAFAFGSCTDDYSEPLPIAPTGFVPINIHVPSSLVTSFKSDTNWAILEAQGICNIIAYVEP